MENSDRVALETPEIEFSTEGYFESHFSKEYSDVKDEIDVFYQDLHDKEEEVTLPVSIFSQELSPLQAIVKYLHESRSINFSEIGRLLKRDPRTIWATYDSVKDTTLSIQDSEAIPVSIFANRELSTLESLVKFLLQTLSLNETADLLAKNYQTIWTVKNRMMKKSGGDSNA